MLLTHDQNTKKSKTPAPPRKSTRVCPVYGPQPDPATFEPLCDESGAQLEPPVRRYPGHEYYPTPVTDGSLVDPVTGLTVTDPGRAWDLTLMRMTGGVMPLEGTCEHDAAEDASKPEQAAQQPLRKRIGLDRPPKFTPRQWVHATGSPESLHAKAVFYLKYFDYETAQLWDSSEMTLAKVVCNLRKYYLQSREQTVELIQTYYCPRYGHAWSVEAIKLTWDLVEPYTPNLGLVDETIVMRERAADLYELVVDLILMLEPGGRVLASELYQYFLALHPDLDPVPTDVAFGIAVGEVTGKKSASSKGKKYYSGFRLPKVASLPLAA